MDNLYLRQCMRVNLRLQSLGLSTLSKLFPAKIDTSPEKEVMQDLISIVHAFSCRVDGLRSYRKNIEELANKQSGDN